MIDRALGTYLASKYTYIAGMLMRIYLRYRECFLNWEIAAKCVGCFTARGRGLLLSLRALQFVRVS